MPEIRGPVVAGVDGSPSSLAAAEYAATLAVRHQAPLHLVHGYQRPLYRYDMVGLPYPEDISDDQVRAQVQNILSDLVEQLHAEHPELIAVQAEQINAGPANVLIEQSRTALATVVGCRGIGGFAELLLGSVSSQLAAHGHGPIIVIRPPIPDEAIPSGPEQPRPRPRPLGPILVGYDGSPAADRAVEFALTEALQRNVALIVANVFYGPAEQAEELLTNAMNPWAAKYPEQVIELRPIESDHPEYALLEASRNTALTVVGSRGRGGFARRKSRCPAKVFR